MQYRSALTRRGNIGISSVSQEIADEQAAEMDASNCTSCSRCYDCTSCTDSSGVVGWRRKVAAANLLALNGLPWSVATNGKHIQIGCQNHSVEEWEAFSDYKIASMADDALSFWHEYKPAIINLAQMRAKIKAARET